MPPHLPDSIEAQHGEGSLVVGGHAVVVSATSRT